ncbi:MAG TPA: aldehyde dehydrogenase family protein [Candidatus Limnocylindria bacterium]|nr:aldehyde dehydrogenase family protein [Candidatus Limnocylindria bacterium]
MRDTFVAPSPATVDLRLFIGGRWVDGAGAPFGVVSPSTGQVVASGRSAEGDQVRAAVTAAARAFADYRRTPVFQRAALCRRIGDALLRRREEIARDLALEQGKTLAEANVEVRIAAEMFHEAGEDVKRLAGEVLPSADADKRIHVVREPIGVVGVITPWNFPLTIPTEYLSACLAVGNAVVWKPATFTPVTAQHAVECMAEAGVPPGVVNLVFGPGPVVAQVLASEPAVTGIGVTGSPTTGEAIARLAGTRRLLLELGGNGPAIVAEDADLDRAIARIARGCFANAGQICDSTERILVQRRLHETLVEGLVEAARRIRLDASLAEGATMGPLNNDDTARKVDRHLADARERGARVLLGGRRQAGRPTALYYEPTVVDGVATEMLLNREETFGPVAPVLVFDSDEEAIRIANDCELGLVAGVFTRDLARADLYARGLQAGIVNVNEGATYWQPHTPFGGYAGKRSGLGRLGGRYTMLELSQLKTVVIDVAP